jgi:hypothetical protein
LRLRERARDEFRQGPARFVIGEALRQITAQEVRERTVPPCVRMAGSERERVVKTFKRTGQITQCLARTTEIGAPIRIVGGTGQRAFIEFDRRARLTVAHENIPEIVERIAVTRTFGEDILEQSACTIEIAQFVKHAAQYIARDEIRRRQLKRQLGLTARTNWVARAQQILGAFDMAIS